MEERPSRPALRYHGSKWRLGPWIIKALPPRECYCEPFGGGAAVLLQKQRDWLEVYNDRDQRVVNFFRVLREQPEALIRAITWTPFARDEWEQSRHEVDDPVENARRFYVRACMNMAGPTATWGSGWRRQKVISKGKDGRKMMTPAPVTFMDTDHLYQIAERLRGVQIENDEALTVIQKYDSPDTLFYIDPPYPSSTRSRWAGHAYAYELSDAEHQVLAEMLHQIQGMAAISGYRCELYDTLYADWERQDRETRVNAPGSAVESLWLSPKATARQLPLLAYAAQMAG